MPTQSDAVTITQNERPTIPQADIIRRLGDEMRMAGSGQFRTAVGTNPGLAVPSVAIVGTVSRTYRKRHVIRQECVMLQFAFSGSKRSGSFTETNLATSYPVKMAVELADVAGAPTGVTIPIYFNGARTVTVQPGQLVLSDPIGLYCPAGTVIYTRTFLAQTAAEYPQNCTIWQSGSNANEGTGTGDVADSGTITGATFPDTGHCPCAVLASVCGQAPGICVIGDSIASGIGDQRYTNNDGAGQGYLGRGAAPYRGYVMCSISGETASLFLSGNAVSVRAQLAALCGVAMIQFGTNDIAGGASADTVAARLISITRILRAAGCRAVGIATVPPRTTTTDAFKTAGNQTLDANESVRLALNRWIRQNAGFWEYLNDIDAPLNDGTGRWKTGGQIGTGTSTSGAVNLIGFSGTPGQWTGYVLRMTSGPANNLFAMITSQTASGIALVPNLGISPTVGGGDTFEILDAYTFDGVHPTTRGYLETGISFPWPE